jgi:hypothetical protein
MTERLIEKLDRLGVEAEIKEMTPEIRRFALLVRQDVVAGWPKREWVGLTDDERLEVAEIDGADEWFWKVCKAIEAKLKEKNT